MKEHLDTVKTLIVRCPNWVGDIVMATPTLDCLRESFPAARIVGLLRKNAHGIVRDGPWFDALIDCQDKSWNGIWQTAKRIRQYTGDVGIILPNSTRSAMTVWLGGAKEIYGYRRSFRGVFLCGGPEPVRDNNGIQPLPMTEYYLEICRWLGLKTAKQVKPRLFIGEEVLRRGESLIRKYGIYEQDIVIGMNPGRVLEAQNAGPPKTLPNWLIYVQVTSVPAFYFSVDQVKKILRRPLSQEVTLRLSIPAEIELTWSF